MLHVTTQPSKRAITCSGGGILESDTNSHETDDSACEFILSIIYYYALYIILLYIFQMLRIYFAY